MRSNHPEFPGLYRAYLLIALDNGGINRCRSVEDQRRDFDRWADKQPLQTLSSSDAWLSSLSQERLELVASGGQDEPDTIAAKEGAPDDLDDLLNSYFDEVC
ncbi:hypothetical protein SAMN06297251_10288 [Fulvimarina manganoxydans]|uniref:Uncharacterized protein n=1 Tax=Fulvimarina manganoxydans TaxID=937218 RepID=A0A1W1YY60_9HYPH|nr:hypothetical protein [Fulvimarina manganoxydans]SMC41167.1 hypothetical protein SAMN06297251_10288 [Fulvimarina manganoxydans]